MYRKIINLNRNLSIKTSSGVNPGESGKGVIKGRNATIQISNKSGRRLMASIKTNFFQNLNWSKLRVEGSGSRLFYKNLTNLSGTYSFAKVYIPHSKSHKYFGFCPHTTSFNGVSRKCKGLYYKGRKSSRVDTVRVNGNKYWVVSGFTSINSGVFATRKR